MQAKIETYSAQAGGWSSVTSIAKNFARNGNPISAAITFMYQNKPRGYACPGCASAKPVELPLLEFCECSAEVPTGPTQQRAVAKFFAPHTVYELGSWSDSVLVSARRLAQPLHSDDAIDRYCRYSAMTGWRTLGARLRQYDPKPKHSISRTRLARAAYLHQLLARMHGTNRLPDCSNMCHETTSAAEGNNAPAAKSIPGQIRRI